MNGVALLLCFVLLFPSYVDTSNVLLMWVAWPSHRYLMSNAARFLCQSGNVVSSVYIDDEDNPIEAVIGNRSTVACNGGTDIRVKIQYPQSDTVVKMIYKRVWETPYLLTLNFPDLANYFVKGCVAVTDGGYFEKLKQNNYDVIGVDSYFDECYLYIAQYLQKPVIRILYGWTVMDDQVPFGNVPLSYVIHPINKSPMHPTSLIRRVRNLIRSSFVGVIRSYRNLLLIDRYSKMIEDFNQLKFQYIQSQHIQLNFMDEMLTTPIPRRNNLVNLQNYQDAIHAWSENSEIGADLSAIVDSGPFIIVSFSTGARHGSFPVSVVEAIGYATDKMPSVTFILQWNGRQFDTHYRPNLHVTQKIPLMSVLGHMNCIMYITACGIAGVAEAIKNQVPIVCLPNFFDQYKNSYFVQKNNLGITHTARPLKRHTLLDHISSLQSNNYRITKSLQHYNDMLKTTHQNVSTMLNFALASAMKANNGKFRNSNHSPYFVTFNNLDAGLLLLILLNLLMAICDTNTLVWYHEETSMTTVEEYDVDSGSGVGVREIDYDSLLLSDSHTDDHL